MKYKKEEEKKYWEAYYSKHRTNENPSFFAECVEPFIKDNTTLLELGCGNGRDSIYLAKNKSLSITALDQSASQIEYLVNLKFPNIQFESGDFTQYRSEEGHYDYIYSRFTLHSINKESELRTIKNSYHNLKKNGLFFIEVRSIYDELKGQGTQVGPNEFITDHYRRFINFKEIIATAEASKFKVIYKIESKNLAPYKDKNPTIIRLILQKG